MKTISAAQRQTLEDLSAEGLLGQLPVQTAEKDIHITDLLRALAAHAAQHPHLADLQLVFAGGTCLSKAHGLIQRMSEDIDIKVVLKPYTAKSGPSDRARLIALHDTLPDLLYGLGMPLLQYPRGNNPDIHNQRRHYTIGAGYQTTYPQLPSLRPELKLELLARAPLLPTEVRSFGYLHEALAGLPHTHPVTWPCISVAETTAEKVLSFLRRCHWQWHRNEPPNDDPTLVRHVHDVACIQQQQPEAMEAAKAVFGALVEGDREQYGRQHPPFAEQPLQVLKAALHRAGQDAELAARYQQQVVPLVFGQAPPNYRTAFAGFEAVAAELLGSA